MDELQIAWLTHLLAAVLAGGLIGLERSYHGRPAGFRTHTLVCMSSSLLMMVALYQGEWFHGPGEIVRIDPTRMAQGIMTGIGFLGAGVIFKEGLSVRGLTTAASIWITASIGVLMGIGLYFIGGVATATTLGVLSLFRFIEMRMPTNQFAFHVISFKRHAALTEPQLRELLHQHGCAFDTLSYRAYSEDHTLEYRMMLRTLKRDNFRRLSETLIAHPDVVEFRVSPTGD